MSIVLARPRLEHPGPRTPIALFAAHTTCASFWPMVAGQAPAFFGLVLVKLRAAEAFAPNFAVVGGSRVRCVMFQYRISCKRIRQLRCIAVRGGTRVSWRKRVCRLGTRTAGCVYILYILTRKTAFLGAKTPGRQRGTGTRLRTLHM